MHGFNTFQVDCFHYPNACSCCGTGEPTTSWRLVHSTIEFPDGYTGHNDHRNYNDYVTHVPICDACHRKLQSQVRVCWLTGGVAGAAAAFYVLDFMADAGFNGRGSISTAVAAGICAAVVVGWLLKMIAVDGFSFARFNGLETTIRFQNKVFQAEFERLNFIRPASGMARA